MEEKFFAYKAKGILGYWKEKTHAAAEKDNKSKKTARAKTSPQQEKSLVTEPPF